MEVNVKVGNALLKFDGRDYKDVLQDAAAFSQATKCGECKSGNIALDYRTVEGKEGTDKAGQTFKYYSIKCMDCFAKASLGNYNAGGLYLKRWEKFEKKSDSNEESKSDIPF